MAFAQREKTGAQRIITTPVEHHAVLHTVEQLVELNGFKMDLLPVDQYGMVDSEDLRHALRDDVALVSIMYATTKSAPSTPWQKLESCAGSVASRCIRMLCKPRPPAHDVVRDQIDLLAIGAHKFYGQRRWALAVRKNVGLHRHRRGGQEDGRRAGTQIIPYIVGLPKLEIDVDDLEARRRRHVAKRDHLIAGIR